MQPGELVHVKGVLLTDVLLSGDWWLTPCTLDHDCRKSLGKMSFVDDAAHQFVAT